MNFRFARVPGIGNGIVAAAGKGPNEGKVFILFDNDGPNEESAGWYDSAFAFNARTGPRMSDAELSAML